MEDFFEIGIIYKLTSPSGKFYIGKTTGKLRRRVMRHASSSKFFDHPMARTMKKYPLEQWQQEILLECDNELLNEKEKFYIKELNAIKEGYNVCEGGEGVLGLHGPLNPMFGKKRPDLSERNRTTNKVMTDARRQVLIDMSKNNEKTYKVTNPEGISQIITSLAKFCRENNLIASCMSNVIVGKYKTHKGWLCERV